MTNSKAVWRVLIRVSGGNSGIKEYLEEGVKNGRDYTRDELDQRVILAGDLEATNDVIQRIDSDHERYMHVTLSFKEDHIDESILQSITDEFRQFIMSAYDDDEYNFYAEAHLPKIKTLADSKSGELVERKPHIHIVIPEINLRNDQRLYPFYRVSDQTSYIDSFQEVINEKYGLASPKVHVRGKFTDESTLSQGEVFAGANKHVKQSVLTQIITHDIRSQDALKTHLLEQGFDVKERNRGKADNYLNIKSPGSSKGLNLKDNVFQNTFLAHQLKRNNSSFKPNNNHTIKVKITPIRLLKRHTKCWITGIHNELQKSGLWLSAIKQHTEIYRQKTN
ncbi:hypothetical protein PCI56_04265 [Plesiomonas shigelloides subsp. oncorhynchi]|nr:hypothetical protein [Plesiomonas shigelloides]